MSDGDFQKALYIFFVETEVVEVEVVSGVDAES